MRPSLLPGLIAAAQKNADRGFPDVALFEVGQVFRGDQPEDQLTAAAGVRRGARQGVRQRPALVRAAARPTPSTSRPTRWRCSPPPARRCRRCRSCRAGRPGSIPGRSGTIQIGPQNVLGHFGELHPRALEALDAEGPLVGFEVILDKIPEPKAKPTRAKPVLELSPFQPVTRDFAFVVDRAVKAADLVRAAQNADRKLITGVTVFDVYEGKGIEPGKKSIAIAVTLQPREKTLTDEEIEAVGGKIVAEVSKRTGGVLRSSCCRPGQATPDLIGGAPSRDPYSVNHRESTAYGSPLSRGRQRSVRHEVCKREAFPLDHLAHRHRDPLRQHRTRRHEGVELALLAAGIGVRRQLGKQRVIEPAPGKRSGSCLRSTQARYVSTPAVDHLARQRRGRPAPEREHRRDAGAGELLLAVTPHVCEKQVAEDHVRYARAPWRPRAPLPCAPRTPRSGMGTGSARGPAQARRHRAAPPAAPRARRAC